jgi:hypothetical protein
LKDYTEKEIESDKFKEMKDLKGVTNFENVAMDDE